LARTAYGPRAQRRERIRRRSVPFRWDPWRVIAMAGSRWPSSTVNAEWEPRVHQADVALAIQSRPKGAGREIDAPGHIGRSPRIREKSLHERSKWRKYLLV